MRKTPSSADGSLPPFSKTMEDHGPALLGFCISQAGPKYGEDVFQETMISALRAYDTIRNPDSIKAWLFSIAARKAIDAHRSAARAPIPLAEIESDGSDPILRDHELWREVGELPEKQRHAVALRFLGDLSHREIGEVMQISEAAARRNVFEGLKQLHTRFESAQHDFDAEPIADREVSR